MSEQATEKDLAKSAEELLSAATDLAKGQICTGGQSKVSHPDSTTENQTEGDAVADNGTDYVGGKPKSRPAKLRKAIMDKLAKSEPLNEIEQLALAELLEQPAESVEKSVPEEVVPEAVTQEVDTEGLEKGISENDKTGINAAPALRAFGEEISKSNKVMAEAINELKKGVAEALETISKAVAEKVDGYAEEHEKFFVKHAEATVGIAKSIDDFLGGPARGSRTDNAKAEEAKGEEVKKGLEPSTENVGDHRALANLMADAFIAKAWGEYGMTEGQLKEAVTTLESTKQIDPEIAAKFME